MIDKMVLQRVSNHPVHILNTEGGFSPSSFIPFCSFGQNLLGTDNVDFDFPVCDIFKPTNFLDQICYETNLSDLKDRDSNKIRTQLEMGLTLVLDFNEERQSYNPTQKKRPIKMKGFHKVNNDDFSIHLDTISLLIFSLNEFILNSPFRSCWTFW